MAAKKVSKDYEKRVEQTHYFKEAVNKLTQSLSWVPFSETTTTLRSVPFEKGDAPKVNISSHLGHADLEINYDPSRNMITIEYERENCRREPDSRPDRTFMRVVEEMAEYVGALASLETKGHIIEEEVIKIKAKISSQEKLDKVARLIRTVDDLCELYLRI